MGSLGILNVGAGDTKLVFDKNDPKEMIRAARIVKDMIRRGYALLIETGRDDQGKPTYRRATDFDENTCEYIIADLDPVQAADTDKAEAEAKANGQSIVGQAGTEGGKESPPPRRRQGGSRRIHAAGTNGIAVSRSAGG